MELLLNAASHCASPAATPPTRPFAQSADFQAWSSASTGCTETSPSEWSIAVTRRNGEWPPPADSSPLTSLRSASWDRRAEAGFTKRNEAIRGFQQAVDQGAVCDVHGVSTVVDNLSQSFGGLRRTNTSRHSSGLGSTDNKQQGATPPESPSSRTSGRSSISLHLESPFNYELPSRVYSLHLSDTTPPQSGSSCTSESFLSPSTHSSVAYPRGGGRAQSSTSMWGPAQAPDPGSQLRAQQMRWGEAPFVRSLNRPSGGNMVIDC